MSKVYISITIEEDNPPDVAIQKTESGVELKIVRQPEKESILSEESNVAKAVGSTIGFSTPANG